MLLDFTGWACVNCRKMEEQVWSDPEVAQILTEDVVLVSLYVDDRKPFPKSEHRVEKYGGKDFRIRSSATNGRTSKRRDSTAMRSLST